MNRHRLLITLVAAIVASTLSARLLAQRKSPSLPQPPPVSADSASSVEVVKALDEALVDLRIAEARGDGMQEAGQRVSVRLRFVLERDSGNLRAKYYQGRLLILSDRAAQALNSLVEWTESRGGQNDPEAHRILGRVYTEMQFYKMAKPTLEKAIELDPRSPEAYLSLARVESKLLNPQEAIDRVQEGIQLLGGAADADTYLLLTEILLLGKQFDLANRAALFAKEKAEIRVRDAGGDAESLAKLDQCIETVLGVVALKVEEDPADVRSCMRMSELLQEQAQVTAMQGLVAALGWVREASRRAGDHPPADLLLEGSRLLMRLGKVDEAIQWADRGVELHPGDAKVLEFRARLTDVAAPAASASAAP